MEKRIISKKEISSRIRREYKIASNFCSLDWRYYAKMMIDTDDGSIWSDVFVSENEWKEYHSDTIHSLDYIPGTATETEKGYIDSAVDLLTDAGWTITA